MSRSEDWTWLDIIANHPSWGVPKFDLSVQEKSPGMESDGVQYKIIISWKLWPVLIEWAPKKRHNPQALQPMASQEYGNILDLHFQALDRKFFG